MNKTGRAGWIRFLSVLAAVGLVFGLAACGGDDNGGNGTTAAENGGEELTQVEYLLPYQDSISFLGILIAKEMFYEEEGLEVETIGTDGADFVAQQLIAGNATYGQTGAQNILIANSRDIPLRGLAQLQGRGIFTIVAPAGSDVTSVEDLRGERLGVTNLGGGEVPIVRASIAAAGLEEGEDVEMVPVGDGGPAAFNALQTGQIAAYAGANNDIAGMIGAGLDPVDIRAEEFKGIPTTELSVMQETLDDPEKREIAIKLARGYRKGAEWAVENPQEALEIACEYVPEECRDMDVAQAFLDAVLLSYERPAGLDSYVEHGPVESYDLVQTSLAAAEISEPQDLSVVFPDEYMDEILQD